MTAVVVAAILVALTLPALLPTWRQAVGGTVAVIFLLVAAGILALRDLEAHPSGGNGPAFFALSFLFGLTQAAVVASLLGRVFAHWLALRLGLGAARRVVGSLIFCGALPLVALAVLSLTGSAWARLAAALSFLSFPLLWFGLALKLAPNNSSKPTPLRGAA